MVQTRTGVQESKPWVSTTAVILKRLANPLEKGLSLSERVKATTYLGSETLEILNKTLNTLEDTKAFVLGNFSHNQSLYQGALARAKQAPDKSISDAENLKTTLAKLDEKSRSFQAKYTALRDNPEFSKITSFNKEIAATFLELTMLGRNALNLNSANLNKLQGADKTNARMDEMLKDTIPPRKTIEETRPMEEILRPLPTNINPNQELGNRPE